MSDRWELGGDPATWPTVSVIMPIRDEADHLHTAVSAVLAQEYPRQFDVCLAVAPSDDGTEAIAAEIAAASDRVQVVPNPSGVTPAGLNAAIRATSGEVIVRVDGHARLNEGYVRRAVETMATTGAVNVGGVQDARGPTRFEQAVAVAQRSRLGTGGARYRVGGGAGPVDTVYLGVFRRQAIEAVGLFDERLIRNQDYELNIRLRQAGGVVWFDPGLSVEYRPRGSVRALARQYYQYGWWKAEVARMHPRSLKLRQLAPVVATLAVLAGLLVGLRRPRALVLPVGYVTAVAAGTVVEHDHLASGGDRLGDSIGQRARVALAVMTMHLAWGIGFVHSGMQQTRRHRSR